MRDRTAKLLSGAHAALYRATRGRVGSRLVANDMLLLHTTGRRSGRRHTVPLLYLRHGDGVAVFASWGGRPTHPDWFVNLEGNPNATVTVGPDTYPVTARVAVDLERDELWERAVDAYDGYASYQSRTDRVIPVVVLRPR